MTFRKRLKRTSLASRLSFWFLAVALVPLFVFGVVTHRIADRSLVEEEFAALSKVADLKAHMIVHNMEMREEYIGTLVNTPVISEALESFTAKFGLGTDSPGYRAADAKFRPLLTYFQESRHIQEEPTLLDSSTGEDDEFRPILKDFKEHETRLYYDLFLISPDGDIVFTVVREDDFGTSLLDGPYKDTELARVFSKAVSSGGIEMSAFKYYAPSGEPAAFFVAPVIRGGELLGVIAMQLGTREMNAQVRDFTGLGETGEIIVAAKEGDTAVFLTPLRHDPRAAFKRTVKMGSPGSRPIQRAVLGENGIGMSKDYRDKEVLAVWRHLPGLDWGMVVKIDADEALAQVFHLRLVSFILAVVTVLGVVIVSIFVSRSISSPVRKLTRGAERIGRGELDHKVGTTAGDEVGELSRAFDKMCEDLKKVTASRDELDREISIRREIEERLRSAQRMEVVGNLTAGVAHEVRNPLNSLMAIADALEKELGRNADCRPLLAHIRTQVNRLSVLMRALLDLGKPLKKADLTPVDLASVCSDALELCRRPAGAGTHEFRLLAPPGSDGITVAAEGERLTQVFVNLLENAAQHSPEGSEIRLVINEPENGSCRVSVVDRGPGVPEDILPKVFEPFFSTRRGGTGLGLSIVKNTVESYGGKVALYNNEGGPGCAIDVVLPIYKGP